MSWSGYISGVKNAVLGRRPTARRTASFDEIERQWRYRSGVNSKNRNNVTPDPRSEDHIYAETQDVSLSRAREVLQNYSVLSWMIDKHLDFVSTFDIQFKTGLDWLDDQLTELLEWWSQAENFDVGRRYSLSHYLRVNDAQKVLAGDMGTLKFEDGRIKAIVSDQIDRPGFGAGSTEGWFRGVKVDPVTWEAVRYSIRLRDIRNGGLSNSFIEVPAEQFYLHAERKYYPDLIRGISPIANSVNAIQDCYEGMNWHLVKMKVAAMFGIVMFEKSATGGLPQMATDPNTGLPVKPKKGVKYDVNMGDGILSMNMEMGEDIKVLESKIPSTETQTYYEVVLLVTLKSLNIPYSFFREDFTNFYGSRGGLLHYLRSCVEPRQANIEFLNHHLKWRITKWLQSGVIKLPKGYDLHNLRWQCVPRGFPWWDPSKEIAGIIAAIQAGLMSPQEACLQTGTNYYENIESIKEALDWAKAHNVNPIWAQALGMGGNAETKTKKADEQNQQSKISGTEIIQGI